ncbi:uncharacterized protein LOC110397018 isoform X2 [Numida meleagris]|uniref:uncharacterized protein LOC110397018 isoform X2 n=1 Tax=Numida meleagris TaxID=8996 RepID=UPI000B3E07A0|nr:uncharacterized protein LOC110397018 isoform X2 [Numida meleagris]
MADFWGMDFFLSLEDYSIFYRILWNVLIIALFDFVMDLWNRRRERQRMFQHRGNQENSRVWDFPTSSQHSRTHSSAPRLHDNTCEIICQFNRSLETLISRLEISNKRILEMPEDSDDSTTWVTASEDSCSSRASPCPLSTSGEEMEAPCPHPKTQENLESSIPERKAEQGLSLSDRKQPDVMLVPTVRHLPFMDEAKKSHLEDPNVKMQAPQHLEKSLSEAVLGQKHSQLPHPRRHMRASILSSFQHRHRQAWARKSAAQRRGQLQKSASMLNASTLDAHTQDKKVPVQTACYRIAEGAEDQQNRLMHLWLEQYQYVERQKAIRAAQENIASLHGTRTAMDWLRDKRRKALRHSVPGNEGSQGMAPSSTAGLVDARGATVGKRNLPEGTAGMRQDQNTTIALRHPEWHLEHRLNGRNPSVVPIQTHCETFRPRPAHAEMRPRHMAAGHRTPRPETPPLPQSGCCGPSLLCLFIKCAWAKLRAAGKTLYSTIKKRVKKSSRKGRRPVIKRRFSTNQGRHRSTRITQTTGQKGEPTSGSGGNEEGLGGISR